MNLFLYNNRILMQFRSIVPLFIVVCLIIVAFFGNLVGMYKIYIRKENVWF
jgi:hypothetical protein